MSPPKQIFSDAEARTLRQLVHDRTGIWYADARCDRLAERAADHMAGLGLGDFATYLRTLTSSVNSEAAFRGLYDAVTVQETSFFRDPKQLEHFEHAVLPELLHARAGDRRLRVWSAACSTGEEAYTLAMIVRRALGERLAAWDVEILGTDLSDAALDVARAGVYTPYALRSLGPEDRAAAFTEVAPNRFRIAPEIAGLVRFDHQNLADAAGIAARGVWDVVFCRNVLIYFDGPARDAAVASLRDALAPGGALLVGHSEQRSDEPGLVRYGPAHAFAYRTAA